MAIDEARQADFPFGAVIVRDGAVIARGRNLGKTNDDPTAHGEMTAIRRGLADHGSVRRCGVSRQFAIECAGLLQQGLSRHTAQSYLFRLRRPP